MGKSFLFLMMVSALTGCVSFVGAEAGRNYAVRSAKSKANINTCVNDPQNIAGIPDGTKRYTFCQDQWGTSGRYARSCFHHYVWSVYTYAPKKIVGSDYLEVMGACADEQRPLGLPPFVKAFYELTPEEQAPWIKKPWGVEYRSQYPGMF